MARRSKLNELVIMTRDVKETYLKVIKDEFIDVIELKSRCVQPNAVGPTIGLPGVSSAVDCHLQ